jgi:hypothetical protein
MMSRLLRPLSPPLALALALASAVGAAGCERAAPPARGVDGSFNAVDVVFDGHLRLLGARVGAPVATAQGATVAVALVVSVERDWIGRRPRLRVAALSGGREVAVAEREVAAPFERRPGDVIDVGVDLAVDAVAGAAGGDLDVVVSVVEKHPGLGALRWPTVPRTRDEAVRVGGVHVDAGAGADSDALVVVGIDGGVDGAVVGGVVVDGRCDDVAWQRAVPRPLVPHLGEAAPPLTFATTLRLLWDKDALYACFEADDDDAFSPYQTRDDPLYEGEAYELFLDPDGDGDRNDGEYVELQANIHDVHFDAAFSGGARKNMNVGFQHDFVTRTTVSEGRVVQEWRVPFAGLPEGAATAGATWRLNAYRLERPRSGGRVTGAEASALSPPRANDFHRLAQFARVRFVR